jgi:multidrug efflux system outer membrane protein
MPALAAMTGCAVGPDYQRPEVTNIPAAYAGAANGWKVAAPQAHLPGGNRWEVFGDPELNRLETEATEANQDIKAAAARFEQARASADVARSGLFPRLGGSFLPVRQRDSENRPAGGKSAETYDSFTVPFDLSYELDLWGRVRRTVEAAKAQVQAEAADVEEVLTDTNASLFRLPERPLNQALFVIPPELPSELLERRPDTASAERRLAAANANIGVAKAAFFPAIKFNGLAGFQSADVGRLFNAASCLRAAGPTLTLPFFQGAQLSADMHRAKAAHEEAVAKYRGTVLAAFAEGENNLAAEHLLAREYEQVMGAVQSARIQLETANNRYREGLVTFPEVATAQNAALTTERTGARPRGLQLVAVVALIKSLGGGWQPMDANHTPTE